MKSKNSDLVRKGIAIEFNFYAKSRRVSTVTKALNRYCTHFTSIFDDSSSSENSVGTLEITLRWNMGDSGIFTLIFLKLLKIFKASFTSALELNVTFNYSAVSSLISDSSFHFTVY